MLVLLAALAIALAEEPLPTDTIDSEEVPPEEVLPEEDPTPPEAPPEAPPETPRAEETSRSNPFLERAARREEVQARRLERAFEQRALKGYPFVPPRLIDFALPTTDITTRLGLGAMIRETEDADTGETVVARSLAGFGRLSAGVRFGRFAGIYTDLGGLAGLGANGDTLVDAGANAAYDFEAGVVVPIRIERTGTAIGFRVKGMGAAGSSIDLGPGIEKATEELQEDDPDFAEVGRYMLSKSWGAGAGASVSLAQAFGSHVALQASVEGGGRAIGATYYDGEDVTVRGSQALTSGGLAFSVDTNPVPLAFMLEYRYDLAIGLGDASGTLTAMHQGGLGLYLNGLMNTIGLELAAATGSGQSRLGAEFVFRAYF